MRQIAKKKGPLCIRSFLTISKLAGRLLGEPPAISSSRVRIEGVRVKHDGLFARPSAGLLMTAEG